MINYETFRRMSTRLKEEYLYRFRNLGWNFNPMGIAYIMMVYIGFISINFMAVALIIVNPGDKFTHLITSIDTDTIMNSLASISQFGFSIVIGFTIYEALRVAFVNFQEYNWLKKNKVRKIKKAFWRL